MFDTMIEIMTLNQERDDYGERSERLVRVAICYAHRTDNSGRKIMDAGAIVYADDVEYTIRWRKEVIAGQFVIDRGHRYEIIACREIGRRQLLRLTCKRHNNTEAGDAETEN